MRNKPSALHTFNMLNTQSTMTYNPHYSRLLENNTFYLLSRVHVQWAEDRSTGRFLAVITDWTLELRQKRGTPVGCSVRAQPQRAWKYGDKRVRTGEVRQGVGLYNSGSAQCSVRITEEQRETGYQLPCIQVWGLNGT